MTEGDPKNILRGLLDKTGKSDGFMGLILLNGRYDARTPANLMKDYADAVNPPQLKNAQGIIKGISDWESRLAGLKSKHDEDLGPNVKLAILINMLPKDYQDICYQQGSLSKDKNRTKKPFIGK